MQPSTILSILASRQPTDVACQRFGVSVDVFRRERSRYLRAKLPATFEDVIGPVGLPVEILLDKHGIPHIRAGSERDALFGLGFCNARDRLWQLDFLRREALGRLSELLGPEAHGTDLRMRTLALDVISANEVGLMDAETHDLLEGYVAGVNRAMQQAAKNLPVEFDLLGYAPEPWTMRDSIAVLRCLWWQLTGRLENIVGAEAASRYLSERQDLLQAFLTPELPDERIIPADGPYPSGGQKVGPANVSVGIGDATGSNNWVVAGARSTTGQALLASDPHLPFVNPSDLYEAHLSWPGVDIVGAHWSGAPGANWGYNTHIAWGLTNNAASPRDLYAEAVNPDNPDEYRRGDQWVPFTKRSIEIKVRGEAARSHRIRSTDLGPIINAVTPSVDEKGDAPLSLRWIGSEHLDDVRSQLALHRATDFETFRAALADWSLPIFNWAYADKRGDVGYQCAGRVPLRGSVVRGYRQADNAADQWQGYIPFDAMPRIFQPRRAFHVTANNRVVPDDYPYPMYGTWAGGNRALRVRNRIESVERVSPGESESIQNDVYLIRAARTAPRIARILNDSGIPELQALGGILDGWDYRYTLASAAPTVFETIIHYFAERVTVARIPKRVAGLLAGNGLTIGVRLLSGDVVDWFEKSTVTDEVLAASRTALQFLRDRIGADVSDWSWGKVHTITLVHPLASANTFASDGQLGSDGPFPVGGPFAEIANIGPSAITGTGDSVRNAAGRIDHTFQVVSGAEYRLLVDFAAATGPRAGSAPARAINSHGQSGQPGSPHFADQFDDWVRGDYHALVMDWTEIERQVTGRLSISPA